MVYADIIHGRTGLERQYMIRRKVFIEEQGIDETLEQDNFDKEAYHVLVFENNEPVATGRVIQENNHPLIGRIAVLKEHRGKQYGDLVVRKLVDFCFRKGEERVEVHSQIPVIPFYKQIGFIPIGDEFIESNIVHKSMYITKDNFYKPCK